MSLIPIEGANLDNAGSPTKTAVILWHSEKVDRVRLKGSWKCINV